MDKEKKEFQPFGKEWEKEVIKLNKSELVQMLKNALNPKEKTIEGCQYTCEGILNDFESGVTNKDEALEALKYYTFTIHNVFAKKVQGINTIKTK